jgi:hypothetical protein
LRQQTVAEESTQARSGHLKGLPCSSVSKGLANERGPEARAADRTGAPRCALGLTMQVVKATPL